MIVKLLTEHDLEFLSLKGGCRGSSESTLVKMSNCWKYHAVAQLLITFRLSFVFQCIDNVGERYEILSLKGTVKYVILPSLP